MEAFRAILERARTRPRRVALPESGDPRVLRAAARLAREGIVVPILIGDTAAVRDAALACDADLADVGIEDPAASASRGILLSAVLDARRNSGISTGEAAAMLRDPLYYAAAMVRAGTADGSLAGATHSTAETLRAALRIVRPAPGVRVVSSFFLMALREPTAAGEPLLAFADCGLVPCPDEEELAAIARQSARSFATLTGRSPRVALLSFSTKGSADHAAVQLVRRAAARVAAEDPRLAVDGELQLDAALIPDVARDKAPGSPVAGRANVLIFPNLDAGNIGYKLVERLAGAQAVGPVVQGLSKPANDLSRGCSEDDVVVAAAVTALQAGG